VYEYKDNMLLQLTAEHRIQKWMG